MNATPTPDQNIDETKNTPENESVKVQTENRTDPIIPSDQNIEQQELREEIEKKVSKWFGEPVLTVEDELLALISKQVSEAYDEGYEAGEKAKPPKLVDAIEFRQEQYGWNDTKMAAMLDLPKSHYSEFKSGKRGLPVNSIRKAYAIGVPASVLLQEELKQTPPTPNGYSHKAQLRYCDKHSGLTNHLGNKCVNCSQYTAPTSVNREELK